MSAVLVAVFSEYEAAESVRLALIEEGFPTDRVELTHASDPGRAGLEPAGSPHGRFEQYFRMLFGREDAENHVEHCTECVKNGGAAVTVLPRGAVEIASATEILQRAHPLRIAQRDLRAALLEHAAAKHEGAWVRNLWVEAPRGDEHAAHCIYCRLEQLLMTQTANASAPRP